MIDWICLFARALLLAAVLAPAMSDAQETYPVRPVRFIVPFAAAGPNDVLARIASQKLTESWGAPVIVEVRDGAGGTIGVSQVVRATPDGYTLLFTAKSRTRAPRPRFRPCSPGRFRCTVPPSFRHYPTSNRAN